MTQTKSSTFLEETTNERNESTTNEQNLNEQNSTNDRHHGSQHSLKSPEDERQLTETNTATRHDFADKGSSSI